MSRIVFLGAGRRVQLLQAFRDARAAADLEGVLEIVATDSDPDAPALRHADAAVSLPPLGSPDHDRLLDAAIGGGSAALFPLIDPYVPVAAEAAERTGATAWTVDASGARVVGDKWLTYQHFVKHGIPTPHTTREPASEPVFPLVVKPRAGSAGKDVFVARDGRELDFFFEYVELPVLQELLRGPEITIDIVCVPGARLLGLGMRRRIKVRGGEVAVGETIWDDRIAAACERIVATLRPDGPITAQCFLLDSGPRFTEINGRFGGGAPLSFVAGMDVLVPICRMIAGAGEGEIGRSDARTGWRMSRFDDAYYEHTAG
jgi:carbamoyl-phosphate synthase large subunit